MVTKLFRIVVRIYDEKKKREEYFTGKIERDLIVSKDFNNASLFQEWEETKGKLKTFLEEHLKETGLFTSLQIFLHGRTSSIFNKFPLLSSDSNSIYEELNQWILEKSKEVILRENEINQQILERCKELTLRENKYSIDV